MIQRNKTSFCQLRHREFGLFQGSCMGMGFWYPMSEMPEQGICRFSNVEEVVKYIMFLCTEADQPLNGNDLFIEPFNEILNSRLVAIGRGIHVDICFEKRN